MIEDIEKKVEREVAKIVANRAHQKAQPILERKVKKVAANYLQQYYDDYEPKMYVDVGKDRLFISQKDMKKKGWSRRKRRDYAETPHRTYNFLRNSFYVYHDQTSREIDEGWHRVYNYSILEFSPKYMKDVYRRKSSFGVIGALLGREGTEKVFYNNFFKGHHGRNW